MAEVHAGDSSHRAPVLGISLLSYLMIVLDISIVITGLPNAAEFRRIGRRAFMGPVRSGEVAQIGLRETARR